MGDNSLYGLRQPKNKAKEISSSTTLAFSSQLASLISNDKSKPTISAGRPKPSKSKSDIFTAHNKNTKKRAAADLAENGSIEQIHQTDIGVVDAGTLHRSKRRMEEKARIYAAMKRGDYIRPEDERGLVDFDRKWAEREAQGEKDASEDSSGSDDGGDEDEELIEYEDEFGRQRRGTRAEVARMERIRRIRDNAVAEEERASARPKMPENLIYGDTVQAAAFNPEENIAQRMQDLAKKRDRSETPPEETHYDATAEVRTKGTGFYGFSKDTEGRRKEMEALERERQETERSRKEREEKKEKRRKELEERRKMIREQRGKKEADKFLSNLDFDPGDSLEYTESRGE